MKKLINKWEDLEELFNDLDKLHRGYIALDRVAYERYKEKIEKIAKENYYKTDTWKGKYYILKKWKLER